MDKEVIGHNRVVTTTSINGTFVLNATTASYYVVIITSSDGGKVGETNTGRIGSSTLNNDCVFSIAGIYKSTVADAGKTSDALDRVITITSIETKGAIVDADHALTSDSVIAVSSIQDATLNDEESLKAARGSDYVVTISGIERAGVVNAAEPPRGTNYVVTLARIERAGVVNAVSEPPLGRNCVVILGRIERAGVVNAVYARTGSASNYVLTLARIEHAGVANAVYAPIAKAPNASDCVVASKSISDTSIDYVLLARLRDNISLVSKRYS
jgi:hypothetical protein